MSIILPEYFQAHVWTALPQGFVSQGTAQISVLVSPQLTTRRGESTILSSFPDWANWPSAIQKIGLTFTVTVAGQTVATAAAPDLAALNNDYWTAIFDSSHTRVDSFTGQDFSKVKPTSFSVSAVHDLLVGGQGSTTAVYPTLAGAHTSGARQLAIAGGKVKLPGGSQSNAASTVFAQLLDPNSPINDAVAMHEPLVSLVDGAPPPLPDPPVLDFHQAIASLAHHPELLPALGLVFTMQVSVPASLLPSGSTVTLQVTPNWPPPANPPTDIPTTNVVLTTQVLSDSFVAAPAGTDYSYGFFDENSPASTPTGGYLSLLSQPVGSPLVTSPVMILDYDVDGASESVRAYTRTVQSAASRVPVAADAAVQVALPVLRSTGPTLVWNNWGGAGIPPLGASNSFNLQALATRQASISADIQAYLADPKPANAPKPIYAEDLTRGWRMDVLNADDPSGRPLSLHWQNATYELGATNPITVSTKDPFEGFVVPAAVTPPAGSGGDAFLVHEAIARWDGWGLAAPRPFNIVDPQGGVLAPPGSQPSSNTDSAGNFNPQISVEFTITPAGTWVPDEAHPLGYTGLPVLRFGRNYQYRVRAVDLSGWSQPQYSADRSTDPSNGVFSSKILHARWEPIQSPYVVPVAPLTAGEGALTIVVREGGVTNGRWLFAPKIHEELAEQHGAFDNGQGLPDPATFSVIAARNDKSLTDLPGTATDAGGNVHLPVPKGSPPPVPSVLWLPDPASTGVGITFNATTTGVDDTIYVGTPAKSGTQPGEETSMSFPLAPTISGYSGSTVTYYDSWSASGGPAWPALPGKLLEVVPLPAPASYPGPAPVLPTWHTTAAADGTASILTLSVVPGSVYELVLTSIPSTAYEGAFGFTPLITDAKDVDLGFLEGNYSEITPWKTVRVVYAVLVPVVAPRISEGALKAMSDGIGPGSVTGFTSAANGTAVYINDPEFAVDPATTSTATWTATWTDPVDNTTNDHPDTDTVHISQGSLIATVESSPYAPAVAPDPSIPSVATPPPGQTPFGQVTASGPHPTQLQATHHIGDTKHHLVTYQATATSRFGKFFAETTTVTFKTAGKPPAVQPVTLDSRGVDVNLVQVVLPGGTHSPAVTVPASQYVVDGKTGKMTLSSPTASVQQPSTLPTKLGSPPNVNTVKLVGTPLQVTYVPTDTVTGPDQEIHILSTAVPPPLKVVKVAPAWSTSSSGSVPKGNYTLNRAGNTLRVYLERPWYATGADELLGVVSYGPLAPSPTSPYLPPAGNTGYTDWSIIGFDPISVSSHDSGIAYTQAQLNCVTTIEVPAVGQNQGAAAPGDPVVIVDSQLSGGDIGIWPYKPEYDSATGLWYADIRLDFGSAQPPPGYFCRLALVRFQPYSNGGQGDSSNYLSPVTLVTFAQPVPDRSVSVVPAGGNSIKVTVSGPGYYGWRPIPTGQLFGAATTMVQDLANKYAPHPNSRGRDGAPATSTMIVEVQAYDESSGRSGDFAWTTIAGHTYRLTPTFPAAHGGSGGSPIIEWTTAGGGIELPSQSQLRLRISELDYYRYADEGLPAAVNTNQRRPFVAHIPIRGGLISKP
jgi:hypothetical protein